MQAEIFSLAKDRQRFMTILLLDRFLACMKPASITLRQLRAGVFFGLSELWLIAIRLRCLSRVNANRREAESPVHDILGFSLGRRYLNSSTGGTLNFGFCWVFSIGIDQPCRDHQLCGVFHTHV